MSLYLQIEVTEDDKVFYIPTLHEIYYDWTVKWGDGITRDYARVNNGSTGIKHTYANAGTYTITISSSGKSEYNKGWLRAFGFMPNNISFFSNEGDKEIELDITPRMFGANSPKNKAKILQVEGILTADMFINDSLPNTLDDICVNMFHGCPNLQLTNLFNFDNSFTEVGNNFCLGMFADCPRVRMTPLFNLPQTIHTIGDSFCKGMFANNPNLTMNDIFNLPQGITEIPNDFCLGMFRNCTNLTMNDVFNLPQPNNVGNNFCLGMFYNCTNLTMNNIFNLPSLINSAQKNNSFCQQMFMNCSNISMNNVFNLPQNYTAIGDLYIMQMFYNCPKVVMNEVFKLPQGITEVGKYFCNTTFYNSNMTDIDQFFGELILEKEQLDKPGVFYRTFYNATF